MGETVSGSQRDHFYPPRQRKLQTMRSRIVEWKATIVFFVALLGALSVAIGSKGDSESLPTVASHLQRHMRVLTADNDIAEFGASIFIGGPWDVERCNEMVDRVANYSTIRKVQFLPTFYWVDEGPRDPPPGFDSTCEGTTLNSYYCYNRFNATTVKHWCYLRPGGRRGCEEVTESEIETFAAGFESCMSYATSQGLDIAINARVDDGLALGGWRNTLVFDPTAKYGKWSYEEAIIQPLADAAAAAARPGTQVDFTLQGEMGATVYFHPEEWREVLERTRTRVESARRDAGTEGPVLVGLGANNNKACGCIGVGIVDAREYLRFLADGGFDPELYPQGLEAIKNAYLAADYISISAYVPMPNPDFELCDFEGLMIRMDEELSYYGFSLNDLTDAGLEIHFGEFGIGGGTGQGGGSKAQTAQEAAETPFFGIGGKYSCEADPFQMCDLDQPSEVREYRRHYYDQAAKYFQQGGCEYKGVKVAYIWGTGSWDALAIYSGDDGDDGGNWSDPVVHATVEEHNRVAQGQAAALGTNGAQFNGEQPSAPDRLL